VVSREAANINFIVFWALTRLRLKPTIYLQKSSNTQKEVLVHVVSHQVNFHNLPIQEVSGM